MKRFSIVVGPYLATSLLIATALSIYGCGDSASVNPVAELRNLTVTPGTLTPAFNGATTQYSVDLSNNVTTTTVTAQPAVSGDTVTINGQTSTSLVITLGPAGSTTPVSIVVSESGSNSRTYTVLLNRAELTGDNSLQQLSISSGTLDPAFDPNTLNYTVNVASSITSIRVTPTAQDPAATLRVNGQAATSGQALTIPLSDPGQSTVVSIVVTAQNGTPQQYTLVVSRAALGGNNNLQRLSVSPGSLSPSFSASRTSYSISVGGRVESITVTAAPEDTNANLTIEGQDTGSRAISLPPGPSRTEVEVVVTAPNGIPKTYFITVNREALSADNNLDTLSVSPGTLDPAFSSGTTQYTVEVATRVTAVTVAATKSDPNALISGDIPNQGQATIQLDGPGTSKLVRITVAAPNGTSKTYNITVKRLAPSTDANLFDLRVNSGTLNPGFRSGELNYTVDVASAADSITVSATKSDPDARMSALGRTIANPGIPTGSVTVPLGLGTSTSIEISVVAEDQVSTRTYTINVNRPSR
ncbi:MAG: cadherin-like beta sandwich domain-containing protein [Nitrospira sp.]|nr:cadherin-like beta sandwich domain-containing protein [Nitrospira sp.]MDH4368563.1 cadherin-like beta sandwich domain-containing protein [Nitrospira sp.]MDH5497933.1 cadherin-like beta sandwich domain-containing protein [Nitrospira sp.]